MISQPGPIDLSAAAHIPPATLKSLYVSMLRIRRFEERVAEVLRSSNDIVCPVHLYIGQEAIAAGVCASLKKEDYVFSTHRSHGHYLAKGGDMKALMAELYGKATGCSKGRGGSMHLASPDIGLMGSSAIVSGTIPLAVGAAIGFPTTRMDNVAVAFFGDGATNEGVFYESLNFASLKKAPVVFVCENNLFSTHMPVSACLAETEIFKKADAFCMPGLRADGNNVVEVYRTAAEAIDGARRGNGPTLIEYVTYRWLGHVGPGTDIDKGLRSKEELDHWMGRCPIHALEKYLLEGGLLSESERDEIGQRVDSEVQESLVFARNSPYPDGSELLDNVFRI